MVEPLTLDNTLLMRQSRDLLPAEWTRLKGLQHELDWSGLRATNSAAIVCEEDGEIVGVGFMHLVPHFEPVWVRPDKRGRGVLQNLLAYAKRRFGRIGVVASTTTNDRVAKLMRAQGMEELEGGRVFRIGV